MTETSSETASSAAAGAQIAGSAEDRSPHVLHQMLDLVQASHLRDAMIGMSGAGAILLDAAAVERMSTPCAQILLAAGRAAGAAGRPFKITNASEVFRAAIADLGLQSDFSNWME
jgi:chemotaxis protein CheX